MISRVKMDRMIEFIAALALTDALLLISLWGIMGE